MSGRDQAIIMILLAVIIAAGFIILDQRDRINELSQVYNNTKFELDHLEAQYKHLYDSYQELDDQASSYRRRIIQLNQEIDKIKNYEPQWRELTVRYSELLLEVARQWFTSNAGNRK
jgi:septation ring formation regulator EzrA